MGFTKRMLFFKDPQLDKIADITGTGADFQPCLRRNLADFRTASGDGLDNGIVDSRFTHFLLQEIGRLFKQIGHGIEKIIDNILFNAPIIPHLRHIKGNAAADAVKQGQLLPLHVWKELLRLKNRKRLQLYLCRPPAKERTLMT